MSFDYLIEPIERDQFFREYYERKPLHISRANQRSYFDSLMTLDDINQSLQREDFVFRPKKVVKQGEQKNYQRRRDKSNNLPQILDDFANNGYTLVLDKMKHYDNKMSAFLHQLNREMPIGFGANIYITPAHSQGFSVHFE